MSTPAIKTSSGNWLELTTMELDELRDALRTENAVDFRAIPAFLRASEPDAEALLDYARALDECDEIALPEAVYEHVCTEYEAVLAPSRIAIFGEGQSDSDIARLHAEALGEEAHGDLAEQGQQLREVDGCMIADGLVVQYI